MFFSELVYMGCMNSVQFSPLAKPDVLLSPAAFADILARNFLQEHRRKKTACKAPRPNGDSPDIPLACEED
jgi:hypothetical protein